MKEGRFKGKMGGVTAAASVHKFNVDRMVVMASRLKPCYLVLVLTPPEDTVELVEKRKQIEIFSKLN